MEVMEPCMVTAHDSRRFQNFVISCISEINYSFSQDEVDEHFEIENLKAMIDKEENEEEEEEREIVTALNYFRVLAGTF